MWFVARVCESDIILMEIFEKIRKKRQDSCYRKMKISCLCEGKEVPSPFEWDRRHGIMVY